MTSGHSCLGVDSLVGAQNHPCVCTMPTPARLAFAPIAAFVRSWTFVAAVLQVFIVECSPSTQSTGSRLCPGGSETTITLPENRFAVELRAPTARIARLGPHVRAQLPTMSVTCGCSADARRFAQRYQAPQLLRDSSQVRGMQLTLTSGITTQLPRRAMSRIVGIHICACESPMTTIV